MSRRQPNPAGDRAAQNQQTLKSLVKIESNKSCADCKRNKHPRWASWNLGIFVCIRCSGIHRGMGTHISRVKSVDLDSWTDEQLQNMLRWGNARANKYWEAKLAPGHVPAEAKIENFIRTKYESKRWVMDGPMPDPATLDSEGDDDVPLNVVQEKAKLDRSSSVRSSSTPGQSDQVSTRRSQDVNLLDEATSTQARPSTTETSIRGPPPPKAEPVPAKQTKPGDSLLGLDFFGSTQAAPTRTPSSASATSSPLPSRPDLKQSILSLYASAPKQTTRAQPQPSTATDLSGIQSPAPQAQTQQPSFGGLDDAFGSLNLSSPPPQQSNRPLPFAGLTSPSSLHSTSARNSITSPPTSFGSGGGFFDTKQKPPPVSNLPAPRPSAAARTFSQSSGFGDFTSASSPITTTPPKPNASADFGGLFDFSTRSSQPVANKPAITSTPNINSAFNLSNPTVPSQPTAPAPTSATRTATSGISSGVSTIDAWGSNEAWSTLEPANGTTTSTSSLKSKPLPAVSSNEFGWGMNDAGGGFGAKATTPQVTADEDFGGWSSAVPPTPKGPPPNINPAQKPPGPADDVWYNVWE